MFPWLFYFLLALWPSYAILIKTHVLILLFRNSRLYFTDSTSRQFSKVNVQVLPVVMLVETNKLFCWMDPYADIDEETAFPGINVCPEGVGSFHQK